MGARDVKRFASDLYRRVVVYNGPALRLWDVCVFLASCIQEDFDEISFPLGVTFTHISEVCVALKFSLYPAVGEKKRIDPDTILHMDNLDFKMGEGSFSTAELVQIMTTSENITTVKKCSHFSEPDAYEVRHFIKELFLLDMLHDIPYVPNIIHIERLGEIFITPGSMSLSKVIHGLPKIDYSTKDIYRWTTQLLTVIDVCHKKNIYHRDLKPENIVLNDDLQDIMVIDWGSGFYSDQKTNIKFNDYVTTRWYRAPELFSRDSDFHTNSDVWSAGCILAELVLRKACFRIPANSNPSDHEWFIKLKVVFEDLKEWGVHETVCNLLYRMLSHDPTRRYSAENCLGILSTLQKEDNSIK
jgi:serine/threonine protein kinase